MRCFSTAFKTKFQDWQTDIFGRRKIFRMIGNYRFVLDGLTFPPLGNPPNRKVINVFQPDFCRFVGLRN